MANWKNHERKTAKKLGGIRHTRAGNFSESAPDVDMPEDSRFVVECKYRKELPKLVTDGLAQASSYKTGKIPLLVMKQHGMRGEIVALKLDDLVNILEEIRLLNKIIDENGLED